MSANPAASEWSSTRGDQWRAHLTGMEASLQPVDAPLLAALQLEAPARIAEVGCGGGGTAQELLRRAPLGSVVHGYDVSSALIEVAQQLVQPDQHDLAFGLADMASAAAPAPYDRLVSRFGVMFFDDPDAAFANLLRWLVPGGRFAFAVWGAPADNHWMTSARDVAARFVALPRADPAAPGPFRYADVDTLLSVLRRAGFGQLAVEHWRGTLPIGGGLPPADAARFALAAFSSFGEALAQAGGSALDEAHRALTEHYFSYQRDGNVRLPACVHLVTGERA